MEIILNIAWCLCSLGLIWFWMRNGVRPRRGVKQVSRRTQVLALAMVVLLLLPVISLSDDLIAAQGLAETDSCLRRATQMSQMDHGHPSVVPAILALHKALIREIALVRFPERALEQDRQTPQSPFLTSDLDSRPPPVG